MLKVLSLQNWKSFGLADEHAVLPLSGLTLFVGPNASGKSNALDALRFLQGAALDFPLSDVLRGRWEGQREVWPPIRGGIAEAAHHGSLAFRIDTSWELAGEELHHMLTVSTEEEIAVEQEHLKGAREKYYFDTQAPALQGTGGRQPGGGIRAAVKLKGKGGSPIEMYSSVRSLLGQLQPRERLDPLVLERAHGVRQALRDTAFLEIQPSKMRDYRPENGGHLGSSGENVSPVLAALTEEQRRDVVDWLSELCAPRIETIDFDRTQLREVMMIVVERGGRRISARSVSDGTLRFLGVLVALLTVPEETLIVLEEPDVGLEPSRIRLLAEILETVPARRKVQIIATTHSPTLLAHLSEEALGKVIAFGRDPQSGDTVCSRLDSLPNFNTLRGSNNVEHLISTGWLERAL